MKNISNFLFAFISLTILSPTLAHEIIDAANIQLEWHTDTNEKLQVFSDSNIFITLQTKDKVVITPEMCRCTFLLYKGHYKDKVSPRIRPKPIKWTPDKNQLRATLTTTEVGPYTLVISGNPRNVKDFSPFYFKINLKSVEDVYNTP